VLIFDIIIKIGYKKTNLSFSGFSEKRLGGIMVGEPDL